MSKILTRLFSDSNSSKRYTLYPFIVVCEVYVRDVLVSIRVPIDCIKLQVIWVYS